MAAVVRLKVWDLERSGIRKSNPGKQKSESVVARKTTGDVWRTLR